MCNRKERKKEKKKDKFPLVPIGNLYSFFPGEDPRRLFFRLGFWARLQESTEPPESSSFPLLFKAAFFFAEYLYFSVVYIYHCVTNYPRTESLKTISMYFLTEYLGSGAWTWLIWVVLAQAVSWGCSQVIDLTGDWKIDFQAYSGGCC